MNRFIQHKKEPEVIFDADPVNILLVDDLPEKLMVYESILEELGQNVMTASTGEEALKLVLRHDFAVILLDVNMPDLDGIETAALIRQRKKSAHTPIIFLTAFTDEISMAQGYASGAVDYLPTPVVPDILKAKIRVFIELSQMRRQATLQAEEHAMRKAAEQSAQHLEFLVNVSEVFARAQGQADILQALIQLPVPFLADSCGIAAQDTAGNLRWTYLNKGGKAISEPAELPEAFSSVEKEIRHALENSMPVIANNPKYRLADKKLRKQGHDFSTAVIVPLRVREHLNAVFVLILRPNDERDAETSLSLANDLISRAKTALENVILVEKIKEADRRKDEFLAMLAHELRNPLAPIRNAVNILKLTSESDIRSQLEHTIERQIEHMVHLVDDLMDVSRITQGKIDLRKQPVSLHDAINHAIETSEPLIRKHNHTLTVSLPENPVWLDADFGRLSQIFSNLLNNAAKYTNNGGTIEIGVRESDASAAVYVKDNGIGIPQDMLQSIFDIFSQVDSSLERSQGGLGLGLTLVKKLVEMHGGTISVTSRGLNTGSEFTVTLPTLAAQEEIMDTEPQQQETTTTVRRLRVMMVDDSEAAAKTMGLMIELLGHDVRLAYDGPSAIELAKEYVPEVVLLDIGLPGMNGYEACRLIKKIPQLENTLFIAQTGWGQDEHRQLSQDAGFHHHLVKPVSMYDLQKILENHASSVQEAAEVPQRIAV